MTARQALGVTFCGLAGVLAAAVLFSEISANYIDAPYWDEWELAPLVAAQQAGMLSWDAVAAPHNEHRPIVARLLLLALARYTAWDAWAECVASLSIGLVGLGLALTWVARSRADSESLAPWAAAAIAVVLLSMNQWENWLWGWQIAVFLTLASTFAVLALFARAPVSAIALVSSIALAVAATFSFANGLLLWAVAIPALWANAATRRRLFSAVWLLCAFVTVGLYVTGLKAPAGAAAGGDAWRAAVFLLRYVGAPVGNYFGEMVSAGAGLLALAGMAFTLTRLVRHPAFWTVLGLAGFSLASGVLVAVGRGALLDAPIVATKYVGFANLFWVALLVGVLRSTSNRWVAPTLALALVTGVTANALQARGDYVTRKQLLTVAKPALLSGTPEGHLLRYFPVPDYLRAVLPMLRAHRLSVFDCHGSDQRESWTRVAQAVTDRTRAGDMVMTSTDWAAACLSDYLGDHARRLAIQSVSQAAAPARLATADAPGRFVLVGGDIGDAGARRVFEEGYPVLLERDVGLYYSRNRLAYLREHLTEAELQHDVRQFAGTALAGREGEPFLLEGWSAAEVERDVPFRWTVGTASMVYVPVFKNAPNTLAVSAAPFPVRGLVQSMTVEVNGERVSEHELVGGWNPILVDVARAPWAHGANVLTLRYRYAVSPAEALGVADDRKLAVRFRELSVR